MAAGDLITSARALYNLNNTTLSSDETTTLQTLVTAVSEAIKQHCRRDFTSTQYDELYSGSGQRLLLLRQYPILSVARVAYAPATVLQVTNTSSSNQRATVSIGSTGLTLVHVAAGVATTNTFAFASYTTLSALKTAINALGSGWSATIPDSGCDNWAASDLFSIQGACNARAMQVELKIHTSELSTFSIDAERGWLRQEGHFCGGPDYWRVIYTAGWSTIPDAVQEACAEWVAALFWQSKRDPGLSQEQLPGVVVRTPFRDIPTTVKLLLTPYRSHWFLTTRE